ncbi:MAG: hypothetical protein Q9198_007147, partial [Flavoplaca austrocitrina]
MADSGKEELRPATAEDTEAAAAGGEGKSEQQEQEIGKPPKEPGSAFLGGYGNAAGDKGNLTSPLLFLPFLSSPNHTPVSSTLSPVGKPVGKGLETVASPVGGLVEPL